MQDDQGDSNEPAMSWISGITRRIKDSLAPQAMIEESKQIPEGEKAKIIDLYERIDKKFKEECYLCGSMLLDTLDNDIKTETDERIEEIYYHDRDSWKID